MNRSLSQLRELGIVAELTERKWGRVFAYSAYIQQVEAELDDGAAASRATAHRKPQASRRPAH